MTTLTDILQKMGEDFGIMNEFTATGGTATTTINTAFANEAEPPDEEAFKNNYLFCRRDAGGAGASPEGRYALISAYAPTTYTITHATLTTAPASGDEMAVMKQNVFTLKEMINAVNRGLRKIGVFTFKDTTSIVIADAQTEYSLPSGVLELLDVQIQTNDNSNDNTWASVPDWKIIPATSAMSAEPLLYIPQLTTGYDIQLVYNGYHPQLTTYDSVIYKFIPEELVIASSKVVLLEGYINSKSGSAKKHWGDMYAEALRQFNELRVMMPTQRLMHKKRYGLLWPKISTMAGN